MQVGWGPGQPDLVSDLVVGNPATARGLETDDLGGPFQRKAFYDSVCLNLITISVKMFILATESSNTAKRRSC